MTSMLSILPPETEQAIRHAADIDDRNVDLTPTLFRTSIGGGASDAYSCELVDGYLSYMTYGTAIEPPALCDVSPAEWGIVVRLFDAFGVGRWKTRYEPDSLVLDGTHWSLEIESPLVSVSSSGDNTYPPRFGTVMAVISALLGGRTFR